MKKLLLALAILLISPFIYPKISHKYQVYKVEKQNQQTIELIAREQSQTQQTSPIERQENTPPPTQKLLEVQFICQAPLQTPANWVFHEESCEEAAVLQALNYQNNDTNTPEEANEIILDMIAWQEQNFGGHFDIYADQLKEFIVGYYNLPEDRIRIIRNATLQDIKQEIANNNPVIAPITGEILKNPYYPYPGYHMLVITGYTEDRIITNDNGTKRGEDFTYDTETFLKALEDAGGELVIIDKGY